MKRTFISLAYAVIGSGEARVHKDIACAAARDHSRLVEVVVYDEGGLRWGTERAEGAAEWCDRCKDAAPYGEWRDQAACASVGYDRFFEHPETMAIAAEEICGPCPVKVECLEYGASNDMRYGVWGGVIFTDRRATRDKRIARARL